MVGVRQHVSWGAIAFGPDRSMGDWLEFWHPPAEERRQGITLGALKKGSLMVADIEEAIPRDWWTFSGGGPVTWMGTFTPTGVLIGVQDCIEHITLFFELEEGGILGRV